jgi:opacity protein-like surface antigen
MEHVMKRLLATAALVALIASPAAAAQSGKRHHPVNPSATSAKVQVTKPALNAYNASRNYRVGTWDPYGKRWDAVDE